MDFEVFNYSKIFISLSLPTPNTPVQLKILYILKIKL